MFTAIIPILCNIYPCMLFLLSIEKKRKKGDTLRFLVNRYIEENLSGVDWLIAHLGTRLRCIIEGIEDAIKCRGLDLSFHWKEGGLLLYDYEYGYDKPFSNKEPEKLCELVTKKGIESHEGMVIGFKIDGTKINCHNCTVNLYPRDP